MSGDTAPPVGRERKFSYFCLTSKQNLCLGVSPGVNEPYEGLYLQLKPYSRNFFKGIDHKKLRWDVIPTETVPTNDTVSVEGLLRLEAQYPTLCVTRNYKSATLLVMQKCSSAPLMTYWVFDMEHGVLRLRDDPTLCATVAKCYPRPDKAQSCIQTVEEVEMDTFLEGSVLHAKECYFTSDAFASYEKAQTFQRELDCVAGCSPEMQSNGRCDEICNNPVCAMDKGECIDSIAPTSYEGPGLPTGQTPDNVGGFPEFSAESPSYWWLLLILLLLCCLTSGALFLRSRRKRTRKVFETDGTFEETVGMSGISARDHLVSEKDEADADESEEARFKTGSAVALNQLRYHSRAASTSNSSAAVNGESVKRRPESSNNDRKYQFEEVGLV